LGEIDIEINLFWMFRCPPDFDQVEVVDEEGAKKMKSKVEKKTGGVTRQYKIMQMMVEEREIPR